MRGGYNYRRASFRGRGFGRPRFRGSRRRWSWLRRRGSGGFAPTPSPIVSWAQSCLAQLIGPWVPQDGILRAATRQAIIQFQNQQSLPPTGALDDDTTQALQAACSGQPAGPDASAIPPPPPAPPLPPPAPPPGNQPAAPDGPRRHGAPPPPPTPEIDENELFDPMPSEAAPRSQGRWVRHRGKVVLLGE
jgi:peptidoglycan hydrolase-like protein with peptidoglycan-binding domain